MLQTFGFLLLPASGVVEYALEGYFVLFLFLSAAATCVSWNNKLINEYNFRGHWSPFKSHLRFALKPV